MPRRKPIVKTRKKRESKKLAQILAKLSIKERLYLENRMSGKSKVESVVGSGHDVGDPSLRKNRRAASHLGAEIEQRPAVQEALDVLLREHDLGLSRILKVVSEGLDAVKTVAVLQIPLPKPGEESKTGNELIPASEQTTSYVDVPDHKTRHDFAKLALSLHGLPEKEKEKGDETPYLERLRRFWRRHEEETAIDTTATEVK